MKVHCLFEQSGTFKKEFIKLGHQAFDYDIQNEFGQTDFIVNLFGQIEGGYKGEPSIFDAMTKDDLIMAFFPCVRFENQVMLWFRGQNYSQRDWSDEQKMERCINLHEELNHNYKLVNQLFITCIRKGLKLIMENPFSEEHYLRRYWCYQPAVIDRDRTERGDYFVKPTQYYFLNCKPQNNLIFETMDYNGINCYNAITKMTKEDYGHVAKNAKTARSMIHPQYANRFIREFILEEQE